MPSWLKRPPAWRSVPSAEERRERALPEPDTSEIDPRTLLEVSDLPEWLQTLAARGDVPVPEPDAAVVHAVKQLQAAAAHSKPLDVLEVEPDPVPEQPTTLPDDSLPTPDADVAESKPSIEVEDSVNSAAAPAASPEVTGSGRSALPTGLFITAAVIILALILVILYLF